MAFRLRLTRNQILNSSTRLSENKNPQIILSYEIYSYIIH
jgi:hypothetical protein